jgi:hypothetical protein
MVNTMCWCGSKLSKDDMYAMEIIEGNEKSVLSDTCAWLSLLDLNESV